MSCKHEFVEAQGTKMDYEKNDNGRIETLIRRKVCWKCYKTKTEIDLEQQLAAANARIAESEAQNKRMQTAINRYVIGNIDLLDALKAALEEKP